ncbi:MAG: peptide-methionine (S)-S-oxide reductase MsrA [Cyanobacteria bacterium J06649_4]
MMQTTLITTLRETLFRRFFTGLSLCLLVLSLFGCAPAGVAADSSALNDSVVTPNSSETSTETLAANLTTATFAGGCFWCMEHPFDELPGVADTTSGYTGGTVESPTYYQVSNGDTGHVEAMQVSYDPTQVSYETLLETFWHNVDPFDDLGQFCDKGNQYRSAIFYSSPEEQAIASATKEELATKFDRTIATDILPASTFYAAEDYHQNYYQTHPVRYKVYRFGCGRDQRLSDIWGSDAPHAD